MELANSGVVSFFSSHFIGFVVGVIASLVASLIFQKWRTTKRWKIYHSLQGVWIEANSLLKDRPFSICEFTLLPNGKLQFKGQSFDNNGNEYYDWWSIVMHVDDRKHRISYIYETQNVNELIKDEGFGCIFLHQKNQNGSWKVKSGYFQDLSEAKARNTRMVRFETVSKIFKRSLRSSSIQDRRIIIKKLLKEINTQTVKTLFGW